MRLCVLVFAVLLFAVSGCGDSNKPAPSKPPVARKPLPKPDKKSVEKIKQSEEVNQVASSMIIIYQSISEKSASVCQNYTPTYVKKEFKSIAGCEKTLNKKIKGAKKKLSTKQQLSIAKNTMVNGKKAVVTFNSQKFTFIKSKFWLLDDVS